MLNALHQGVSKAVQSMNISQERGEKTALESVQIKESLAGISKAVSLIHDMGIQTASAAEQQSAVAEDINQIWSRFSRSSMNLVKALNRPKALAQVCPILDNRWALWLGILSFNQQ